MVGSLEAEGQLYALALIYTILYREIAHPQILVSMEVLEPIPHQ